MDFLGGRGGVGGGVVFGDSFVDVGGVDVVVAVAEMDFVFVKRRNP